MRTPILVSVLLLVTACLVAAAEPQYDTLKIVMPQGDADAGRVVFVDLYCTSCHAVAGETGLPAPISANPGPTLDPSHAAQEPSKLASSIVAPSHVITDEVRAKAEGTLSPMGDYSEAMTVRQLADVVAYLRSIGSTK